MDYRYYERMGRRIMPATVKQTLVVEVNGEKIVITDESKILSQSQSVSVICDSPRHEARFGNRLPLIWNEQEAAKDVNNLPDGFFQLIKLQPNPLDQNHALVFCGAQCCKDWLTYCYVPFPTAKQLLEKEKESLKITEESQKAINSENKQMTLPFSD